MIKSAFIVLLSTIFLFNVAHSEIFRSVDDKGNIIFTDQPREDSEKVELPGLTTYKSPPHTKIDPEKPKVWVEEFTSYENLTIQKPSMGDTIRDTNGDVLVVLQITPELQAKLGHRIIFVLDGRNVANTTTNKFTLTKVDQGSHTLTARILDSDSATLISSKSVIFSVLVTTDPSEKSPSSGYDPDFDSDFGSKPSDGYDPGTTPSYKSGASPGYTPGASPGYTPKPSPGYKP